VATRCRRGWPAQREKEGERVRENKREREREREREKKRERTTARGHFAERRAQEKLVPVECDVRDSLSRSKVRDAAAGHQQGSGQRALLMLRLAALIRSLLIARRSASVGHESDTILAVILFSCISPAVTPP